jgi:hypothetical protein
MSRQTDLLRKAADALEDQRDPLVSPFLGRNEVTLDELFDMADLLAVGARVVAWAMDNPRIASAAFNGMKMEELIVLMEKAGWGERR